MRVGDEEREQVVAALRKQFAEGKLSLDDFGDRVEAAYAAVTSDDLYHSVRDLGVPTTSAAPAVFAPPERPEPPEHPERVARPTPPAVGGDRGPVARRAFYAHLGPYVVVNVFLVMIYILTDLGGYFWPIWPMMGWGVALGIHAWAAFVLAHDRT